MYIYIYIFVLFITGTKSHPCIGSKLENYTINAHLKEQKKKFKNRNVNMIGFIDITTQADVT